MTKAQEVLDTVELLEMILLEVDDECAVLISQRVNKSFRGTIQGSTRLRKKIWLESDDYDAENDYSLYREDVVIVEDEEDVSENDHSVANEAKCSQEQGNELAVGVELNPCLMYRQDVDLMLNGPRWPLLDVKLDMTIHPDAMAKKEQSWQKMEILRFTEPYAKFCITVLIPRFARTYYHNFKRGTTFKDVIEYVKVQADDWTWT
ncbi:hypothetical protein HII31_01981 [Pseudocercospora fuligena]|uniref:Uncharacterized protein n=1 Tax=Pseudocercospora fuligena TaxID=685502 RepID=A0A8H6RUT9_9PEZI|nr:hypothetical protein HII31_01981 [Pseudocercospora fuligena]